jgi:hypothetical protein
MLKKPQYKKRIGEGPQWQHDYPKPPSARKIMPALSPPESTPGVPHTVEGYNPEPYIQRRRGRVAGDKPGLADTIHAFQQYQGNKDFKRKQSARARIKPIIDPDEGKSKRRRAAAKRQQGGRLGTMLTQRETLG